MSDDDVRLVMDLMPYGVYIIGSKMAEGVNAMIADWVVQVSFKPRMLAISFENDAKTLANIRSDKVFTVNFLSEGEEDMRLAGLFAQPYFDSKVHGPQARGSHEKLEGIRHTVTKRGCPVLGAALAWLECEAGTLVSAGDHTLVIGEVLDGKIVGEGRPLTSVYTGWNYSG